NKDGWQETIERHLRAYGDKVAALREMAGEGERAEPEKRRYSSVGEMLGATASSEFLGFAWDEHQTRIRDLERLARSLVTGSGHTLGCLCDDPLCKERARLFEGREEIAIPAAPSVPADGGQERTTAHGKRISDLEHANAQLTERLAHIAPFADGTAGRSLLTDLDATKELITQLTRERDAESEHCKRAFESRVEMLRQRDAALAEVERLKAELIKGIDECARLTKANEQLQLERQLAERPTVDMTLTGNVSGVRVFDRVLSPDEIKALYIEQCRMAEAQLNSAPQPTAAPPAAPQPSALEDHLAANPCATTFMPYAIEDDTSIKLYIKGDAEYSEQSTPWLEVYRSLETKEVIGVLVAKKERKVQPSAALEAAFTRDDMAARLYEAAKPFGELYGWTNIEPWLLAADVALATKHTSPSAADPEAGSEQVNPGTAGEAIPAAVGEAGCSEGSQSGPVGGDGYSASLEAKPDGNECYVTAGDHKAFLAAVESAKSNNHTAR
ncbi:MAG: hypothetical protein KGL39_32370, partial [Patescibacteria group bacterium]|nr:hypothetical protein [Patescibacteria group bacterium]